MSVLSASGDSRSALGIVSAGTQALSRFQLASSTCELPSIAFCSSALALYLDCMNLFLFLLRFSGNRRQD